MAVMGCVVNGPGESKHANIGISLPGTFEEPKAPVYIDGKLSVTLKGEKVPGREMPMLACLDSPGPFTTQPMTATCSSSTPRRARKS